MFSKLPKLRVNIYLDEIKRIQDFGNLPDTVHGEIYRVSENYKVPKFDDVLYEGLKAKLSDWARKNELLTLDNEKKFEKQLKSYISWMVFIMPTTDPNSAIIYLLIKMNTMYLNLNDFLEKVVKFYNNSCEIIDKIRLICNKALGGNEDLNFDEFEFFANFPIIKAVFNCLTDIYEDIKTMQNSNYFTSDFNYWLELYKSRFTFEENWPEIKFMNYRHRLSATKVYIEFVFLILDINVEKNMRENLVFQMFIEKIVRIVAFTNDIFSLEKEIKEGDAINLVLFKWRKSGNFENSFQEVISIVNEDIEETYKLVGKLEKIFPENLVIQNMINCMKLFCDGHLICYDIMDGRYGKGKVQMQN